MNSRRCATGRLPVQPSGNPCQTAHPACSCCCCPPPTPLPPSPSTGYWLLLHEDEPRDEDVEEGDGIDCECLAPLGHELAHEDDGGWGGGRMGGKEVVGRPSSLSLSPPPLDAHPVSTTRVPRQRPLPSTAHSSTQSPAPPRRRAGTCSSPARRWTGGRSCSQSGGDGVMGGGRAWLGRRRRCAPPCACAEPVPSSPHLATAPPAAHVSAEQLRIRCHYCRARPHNDKHGCKDERLLCLLRANRQDAARGPGDGMQESVAM